MGYRGKTVEKERARDLRVRFEPKPRHRPIFRSPSSLHLAKLAQIEEMNALGVARIGVLSDDAFLAAGVALYAGEGSKGKGCAKFANSDPQMIAMYCRWLRRFFAIDEARIRVSVDLHEGLDMEAAHRHWSGVTGAPIEQITKGYRPVADPSIRTAKHESGCCYVMYSCSRSYGEIMGLVRALLSSQPIPG